MLQVSSLFFFWEEENVYYIIKISGRWHYHYLFWFIYLQKSAIWNKSILSTFIPDFVHWKIKYIYYLVSDFELMLDMVASKVSSEIHMIAASLQLDHYEVDQITRDNQHSMQEKNFQILYYWRNKIRGNKALLLRALSDVDRQDVVEAIETFNRNHYKCPGVTKPDQQISMNDIRLISREIAHEYLRLARFLRLSQK